MNLVDKLTKDLQTAYVKAGEEMGRQMSAALVALVTEVSHGRGRPGICIWSTEEASSDLTALIPDHVWTSASWIILVSPGVEHIPMLKGDPTWKAELMSGHVLLVLA